MKTPRILSSIPIAIGVILSVMCCLVEAGWLDDLHSGRTLALPNGVHVRVDNLTEGVNGNGTRSYFGSHILRVFVGDSGITIRKAKGHEGLQFGVFTTNVNGTAEARGSDGKLFGALLPLLIGFKIAGAILATLVAVVVVSLKSFLASTVALLLSGSLALKKMMSHHAPVHYPVEYVAHPHPEAFELPPTGHGYNLLAAHEAFPSYDTSSHENLAADSNLSQQYVNPAATTATSATTNASTNDGKQTNQQTNPGGKRRVFKRKHPILPLLMLHRLIRRQ